MIAFFGRSLVQKTITLFFISVISFAVIHLAPGEPSQIDPLNPKFTKEVLEQFRQQFHLDKPLHQQYFFFYRDLFTGKGCVVCHSINWVGGKAGPALDADPYEPGLDVFDFAARMWRGAPTMIVLQEMELGYQIELTGQELADLARFIHDAEAQRNFQETDVPELIRDWMVDEVYDELDIEEMGQ